MTTEQQARETEDALAYIEEEAHNRNDSRTLQQTHKLRDFIAQAAVDKAKLELYSSLASKYEELRALIDNGHESYTHDDALFRVTEDRRIADTIRDAAKGEVWTNTVSGFVDKPDGTRVLIIHADAVRGSERDFLVEEYEREFARIKKAHDSELMLAMGGYYNTEQYEAMTEVIKLIDKEQLDLADSKLNDLEKELGSLHPELTRAKTLIHFLRDGTY